MEAYDHASFKSNKGYNPAFRERALENEARRQREKKARLKFEEEQRQRQLLEEKKKAALDRLELENTRLNMEESKRAFEAAIEKAKDDLSKLHEAKNVLTKYDIIERRLCRVFNVSKAELMSRRRDRHLALCRQAIFYWAARRTGQSLPWIGKRMQRDHTSVMHGRNVYPDKRAQMGRTLRRVRPTASQ